jgi:uncharacterized protein
MDTLAPFLRNGDFFGGINAVIDSTYQRVSGEVTTIPAGQSQHKKSQPNSMGALLSGAIMISVLSHVIGRFVASGIGAVGVFLFVWLVVGSSVILALLFALVAPLLALAYQGSGGYIGGVGGGTGGSFGGSSGSGWSGGGGGFGGGGSSGSW